MSSPSSKGVQIKKIGSGVAGLDDVLGGGVPAGRLYLLEGDPGTGKTTLSLQFLLEGRRAGQRVAFITLSESRMELTASAASHGWSLDDVEIREYVAAADALSPDGQVTMFRPSEVELLETVRHLLHDIEVLNPDRVVVDSLSELRLLAQDSFRYRRQLLALKEFFLSRQCTVLLLDDRTAGDRDRHVQSIVHGVIHLEQLAPEYGSERRRLRLSKIRGTSYRGGWHDYLIRRGGLEVFPRLAAAEHRQRVTRKPLPSGIASFDKLLGGGTQTGTSLLILGPAGVGKTTLAVQFALAGARRGQRCALFTFDETADLLLERTVGIGLPLREFVDKGLINVRQVDPAEMSPGQFAHVIRRTVEEDRVEIVIIDSLNGYLSAMPDERQLTAQLHELLAFLGQSNVATILVFGQQGMLGSQMSSPVDTSYLADTIVLMRFFEVQGRVRKAISVVKKRSGAHEDTIRELAIGPGGLVVGKALTEFHGVLTGVPVFKGTTLKRLKASKNVSAKPRARRHE
jgi:circadian clock protein KaiC